MRRWLLVPETVQTSAMDCGPTVLKSLLQGFGISASYGRLREACQTDVDGTSIDQIEDAANQLGLEAEQSVLPEDHLLRVEATVLPALAVVRQPNGATHFVIVWRKHGTWLQIMDPATGRRWVRASEFLATLYQHEQAVPETAWAAWARSEDFLRPLRGRLRELTPGIGRDLVAAALASGDAAGLAALDAAVRMTESLARAGAVRRGGDAGNLVEQLAARAAHIPDIYWSVKPGDTADEVSVRGAVIMRVLGVRHEPRVPVSAELAAALQEAPTRPGRELWRMVREDGLLEPVVLGGALVLAAVGAVVEVLLFRSLLEVGRDLVLSGQRLALGAALMAFLVVLLLIEWPVAAGFLRQGRRLEARLRLALYRKMPLLGDRYFQSRLISDMADRAHSIHLIRQAPGLAGGFLRVCSELAVTTAGLAWLERASAWPAVIAALAAVAIPLCTQRLLTERDFRWRNHAGGLSRFYLDALIGLTAIRAHGAEQAIRYEQNAFLTEWAKSGLSLLRASVWVETLQTVLGVGLVIWLMANRLAQGGDPAGLLLFAYWALSLPALGAEAVGLARQYPAMRNITSRLIEPLGAREENAAECETALPRNGAVRSAGVAIELQGVLVKAAGHTILEDIDLQLHAGEHVAIVGPSGAGKSSLAGLLLGWHSPASGSVSVDGEPLTGSRLAALRQETAWVDPQVQLWNRTLLANLQYGQSDESQIESALSGAQLMPMLKRLPQGMQSQLGEGGALLSGGEGQRVRAGRALMRGCTRLVILDEPARGLDRSARRELLSSARRKWRDATMLVITHDVGDILNLPRVLVVDNGRILEDGCPQELARQDSSRFRRLLDAERSLQTGMWTSGTWRRLQMHKGILSESTR